MSEEIKDTKKEIQTCPSCKKTVDIKGNDWFNDADPSKNISGETTYWHLKCHASKLETNKDTKLG